ncbi:MAG TPA: hypothetical protein PLB59_11375 [Bacteroidales bacterium]|nr:hypothetical protein [Bacteroidales bacterium]HQP16557.1 hypothetical protein [Bacteroidales bacterium]
MKTTVTKIIISWIFLLLTGYCFAQAPQAFNYQAVARDVAGNVLVNQNIGLRVSIHLGSATGAVSYSETFAPTTNEFGLFTLAIGTGTIVDGQFDTIAWGRNQYWMQVEMDAAGGTTYADMGTTQLLSVPYALFAERTKALPLGSLGQTLRHDGMGWLADTIIFNNGTNVGIGTSIPGYKMDVRHNGGTGLRVKSNSSFSVVDIDSKNGDAALRFAKDGANYWLVRNNPNTDNFEFYELGGGGLRMVIQDSTGFTGIGTSTPAYMLDVKHTVTSHSATLSPTIQATVMGDGDTLTGIVAGQNGYQGLYGKTTRNYGYGAYGIVTGYGGYGVYGQASGDGSYGVYGSATLGAGTRCGVRGYASSSAASTNYGVYGYAGNATSSNYGVYGMGGTYGVYASGNLGCSGTKPAVIRTSKGPREMYAMESPNIWFEDIGEGKIVNGSCYVAVSEDFAESIFVDESHPFHVFITPYANIGNWWIEKSDKGFTINAPDAANGAKFSYRITAYRKGYQDLRMKIVPGLYTDHVLYPDIKDVPNEFQEEWKKVAEEPHQQK